MFLGRTAADPKIDPECDHRRMRDGPTEQPIWCRSRGLRSRWLALFDRAVGTHQQRRGQLQADRIGGLDVDRELDRGRELNRQFVDLGAPPPTFGQMGEANYILKRYREAVHWWREQISRQPVAPWASVGLACAYAQLGQLEEMRAAAAEVLRINPGFTIESSKRILVYKDPQDLEHYVDGMRKAGLPES
jgi:tetratricopeptide (TPR) repeat protein